MRRSLWALLAPCFFISFISCRTYDEGKVREDIKHILTARKDQSLQNITLPKIKGQEDAIEYAARHTAPLFEGIANLQMRVHREEGETPTFLLDFGTEGKKAKFTLGSAVLISSDGYFLTAAHCVDNDPVHVVVFSGGHPKLARARVVWTSGNKRFDGEPDLAVIHATAKQQHLPFEKVNMDDLQKGRRVISSGYGGVRLNQAVGHIGKVGRLRESKLGARWWDVYHTAPLYYGDSGGLLMNEEGRVLGINYSTPMRYFSVLGHPFLFSRYSKAILPDPDWIKSVIEEDRKMLKTSRLRN